MNYISIILIFFICFYSAKFYPGVTLSYILFFQSFNKLLFEEIGFVQYRYVGLALLIIAVLVYNFNERAVNENIKRVSVSKISWGYCLICLYYLIVVVTGASSEEMNFIQSFIFPGIILFIIGSVFVPDKKAYQELLIGIIFFSMATLASFYIFRDFEVLSVSDRDLLGEVTDFGRISQGRVAGHSLLLSLFLGIFFKNYYKYFALFTLIISAYWLSIAGTRGALVSLSLALSVYLILTKYKLFSAKRIFFFAIIFIPALIYLGIKESSLFVRTGDLLDPGYVHEMARYKRFIVFFQLLKDYPFLGLGPQGFKELFGRRPHNLVIEFVVDYGIIGTFSLLLIFVPSIKKVINLIKSKSNDFYIKAIALSWIYFATNSMFSGDFLQGNPQFLVFTAILITVSQRYSSGYRLSSQEMVKKHVRN